MEDLASMCVGQCCKACNLRPAAEELGETGSNGRARRYRKRGSPKPAGKARAMETDPSLVRLWSAADSEGHYDGYRSAFPSESEEMAILPTRAHTAPEPSLEHDAEALQRPTRARTAPVARHTEPTRDNMGDTPMAEESEAPGTVGCAGSGGKHVECHCEHVSLLIGQYPKMGMDAIVKHLDRLDNHKDGEKFIVFSALCFASSAACCWCRVSCCLFLEMKSFVLMKYSHSKSLQDSPSQ